MSKVTKKETIFIITVTEKNITSYQFATYSQEEIVTLRKKI